MSEPSLQELQDTAAAYDELLVPPLFEPWAGRVADAAEPREGDKVLDVACGTGILARTIASRLGVAGSVSGLDLNPGMLAVARQRAAGIGWHEGNAEALPFEDTVFDTVVSQFGLMLFPSPESALREMHRVLRHGGRLVLALFDSLDEQPAYKAVTRVYERVVGADVGGTLGVPFSMGDTAQIAALISETRGFDTPRITTMTGTSRFLDARHLALADIKGWFPFAGIHLDEETVKAVTSEIDRTLEPYCTADGGLEFPVRAHIAVTTRQ